MTSKNERCYKINFPNPIVKFANYYYDLLDIRKMREKLISHYINHIIQNAYRTSRLGKLYLLKVKMFYQISKAERPTYTLVKEYVLFIDLGLIVG